MTFSIRELRRALGEDPRTPRYIETIHRRGYRFIAPLTTIPPVASSQEEARDWKLETSSASPQASSLESQAPRGVAREAEGYFLKALDITRQQQAKSLELRAVMSLVRLLRQHITDHATRNTPQALRTALADAHSMLAELYAWFTEGFDTKDLQEAKALLEELER